MRKTAGLGLLLLALVLTGCGGGDGDGPPGGGASPVGTPAPNVPASNAPAPGVRTSGPAALEGGSAGTTAPTAPGARPGGGAAAGGTGPVAGPPAAAAPLGAEQRVAEPVGPAVVATVFAYRQPVPSNGESEPGEQWGALDAQLCVAVGGAPAEVTNDGWRLELPDRRSVSPAETVYPDFPQPTYPLQSRVEPGTCQRGWITFPVPVDQRPGSAVYAPDAGGGRWRL